MTAIANNSNREIRVFISSTFRDMHAERDYLVSHVFPVIRRACRERQVEFTEIDLRWGVTKEDAEQGKVVRICLEEINRCRPYFLSLLGERYGWAPLDTDLNHKAELLALFPFLENSLKEGLSVTEMEILHGVMDNPDMAGHCFFYLRDLALTQSLADSLSAVTDYFETEQRLQDKLDALKDKVRNSGLPLRDNYASIEALGDLIKQDLLAVLDQQFPVDLTPTLLEAEQNAHRSYANDRCKAYIANPRDTEALDVHLNTKTNNALLVTGESGLGKSALLAYWLNQQRLIKPEQFIIEHYVGISGDADPAAIIRRIMAEIKLRTDDSAELPSKPEDIIQDFPLWLAKVGERDPLLLIIDGLNQLDNKQGLWLPGFWQENVKAIFSVIPGEQLDQLLQNEWPIHTLEALDLERREQLIREWLASYRKALSTEQTLRIAQAPQTGNPLFLKTVLEELRIFGYFEHLDQRITTLLTANNPQKLFVLVLERLENDFGKHIVTQIMQALCAARRGLSETEIAGITGLSRLVISTFLMAIDAHLAKRGGLLNFFHDYLRQAVKLHGLESKETEINAHIKLAQYFEQQELNDRVAEELPWQWQQAEQWEALKDCISAIPMFEVLYEKDDLELLAYWLAMEDQFDAGKCYTNSLASWERGNNVDQKELADFLSALAYFLTKRCVRLNMAEPLCRRALAIREKVLGAEHPSTAISLDILADLLQYQGKYDQAEPLYRRALAINEKALGANHSDTATSLNNLATLLHDQRKLDEAESLCRRSLTISEKMLGADHPTTACSLNNLAGLLKTKCHYKDVEALYRRALTITEKALGCDHLETAVILNNLAVFLDEQEHYEFAEPLYRRALTIREKVLGGEHPDTVTSLSCLAGLLQKQHQSEATELIYRRILVILEKVLGAEHPDIATSLNHLATLLRNEGKYDEAKTLCRRALVICEKVFGVGHLETTQSLTTLALLLHNQGSYSNAEPLFRRVVTIREKVLGAEHPDTADSLNNLATLLHDQRKLDEAESLCRRALTIREEVLGLEHADTATSLNNLANLLYDQDKYDEAEPLYRHALTIREKILGLEHVDTATGLNNLANLLRDQSKYDEAEPLCRRALTIREEVLGREHADTATSLNNLANLLYDQDKYDEAEPLYRRALTIREKVLGREHADTATSFNNLANLLYDQSKYDEAEPLYRRALTIREKFLGTEHPDTAKSLSNIAVLLVNQGKYDEADPLLRRALAIREKILGLEHLDTANSFDNLASLLFDQDKYDEAELLLRHALAIREKVLSLGHLDTATSLNNLAFLLEYQGKNDEAELLYRRALAIYGKVFGAAHPSTLTSMHQLGVFLREQEKYEDAELFLREVIKQRKITSDTDETGLAGSLNALGLLLAKTGRIDEAITLYNRALVLREEALGSDHPMTVLIRERLTEITKT